VYVFRFDGEGWSEEARLTASDGAQSDYFGRAVSVSGDTILVGAYGNDDLGSNSGSVYVFRFNGSSWVEVDNLTVSDGAANAYVGFALAQEGNRALIGAYGDNDNGTTAGAVYVFGFNGSDWVEQQKLTASDGAQGDFFGRAVALSGDAALVGAAGDDLEGCPTGFGGASGSAYLFRFDGLAWTEEQKLTASDGAGGDSFGGAVGLDGETAVIAAAGDGPSTSCDADDALANGAVYLFQYASGSWVEGDKHTAGQDERLGYSVAIAGGAILAGAPYDAMNGTHSGSAYVFGEPAGPIPLPALGQIGLALLSVVVVLEGLRRLR
jgi:hypothetical protein